MRPFDVSPVLEPLRDAYPSADTILEAARKGDRDVRYAISRLWLSEGIPHCFRAQPSLYEALRSWLAHRLQVHAKEITLIGSGRLGFCLSPGPDLCRPFGEYSDLDFTVVSKVLFQQLEGAFVRWMTDYAQGTVHARHARESMFWEANKGSVPSGIARGFIDPHKIPTWNRYPEAQIVGQAKYEAHEKLRLTPNAPAVRNVSVRVYRDWDCFIQQLAINLKSVAAVAARADG